MSAKMSKTGQILLGIGAMLFVWVLGILLSGEWTTADTAHLSVFPKSFVKPSMTFFPFFLIALLIFIGTISARRKYKALYVTFEICTALPLISFFITVLLSVIFGRLTILNLPFLFLYSPIHVLRSFPLFRGFSEVVAPVVFTTWACLSGYASYRIEKSKIEKKTV